MAPIETLCVIVVSMKKDSCEGLRELTKNLLNHSWLSFQISLLAVWPVLITQYRGLTGFLQTGRGIWRFRTEWRSKLLNPYCRRLRAYFWVAMKNLKDLRGTNGHLSPSNMAKCFTMPGAGLDGKFAMLTALAPIRLIQLPRSGYLDVKV